MLYGELFSRRGRYRGPGAGGCSSGGGGSGGGSYFFIFRPHISADHKIEGAEAEKDMGQCTYRSCCLSKNGVPWISYLHP